MDDDALVAPQLQPDAVLQGRPDGGTPEKISIVVLRVLVCMAEGGCVHDPLLQSSFLGKFGF